ncbi:MAG: PDZ domain-containing protein [Thermovirgaceae bacterium]|nr:PDZ domain-containing protein [Thermovirgaceae bacterium]
MKRKFASLLLLLFLVPGTASAANWVLVKETSSLGWKMYSYVDADTVLKKESILTFWFNSKVVKPLGASEKVQKIEANLSTHQYRILEIHVFVNGKPGSQSLTPTKYANDSPIKDEINTALQYAVEGTDGGSVPAPTISSQETGGSQPPPKNEGAGDISAGADTTASLFTMTIMGTTIPEVQDVILEIMTREKYTLEEVNGNKVVMGRQGPSVLFIPGVYSRVRFNMVARDTNVKLMVNQVDSQGPQSQQQPIAPLVPLIKEIRNRIDGTPKEQITNETITPVAETATTTGKTLGIRLGAKTPEGYIVVDKVEPGSKASEAGLTALDVLLEVNGRPTKEFEVKDLQSYLEKKWSQKASILVVYSRDGKTELATIKD